jgi:hypothetical protein
MARSKPAFTVDGVDARFEGLGVALSRAITAAIYRKDREEEGTVYVRTPGDDIAAHVEWGADGILKVYRP